MNIDHRNCDHDATKAARTICRKARAAEASSREVLIQDLIEVFNEGYSPQPNQWVWYAARHFASYKGEDLNEAAAAVLDHFRPSGDEARDSYRRRNGYIITESHYHMLQITLRSAS